MRVLAIAGKLNHIIAWILRSSLIVVILKAFIDKSWTILFVSALALFLMFLPKIVMRRFDIELPTEFEFIIVIFIYAALFLGEVHNYYTKLWWWDIALHGGAGLVLGMAGFIVMFALYEGHKIKASPGVIVFFAFCFALALGAVWEIFEFTMDQSFGLNMQKSGIVDTMWDLIVDSLGALFASILGYIYLKGGKTHLFERLLTRFVRRNPRLFEGM